MELPLYGAVTAGWIDQQIHGQITVYVMICFIVAVMYSYEPKVTALLYGLSGIAFLVFLTLSQEDSIVRQGHYINATLAVALSYFLSTVLYKLRELNQVPNFVMNPQEIRQLLLNLVRNGLEAMSRGGQLRISTFSYYSEVFLTISDDGNGMEEYMLEKLGTPFFTTKDKGTGLGLAVCYRIVSRHNGNIHVESSPKGTTFSLVLETGINGKGFFVLQFYKHLLEQLT